jgi:alpha-L-fucosidase 2
MRTRFPDMPQEWSTAAYQNLRAEGAFLVSAIRKEGRTSWVRIESLAGEPCKVKLNFTGAFACDRPDLLKNLGNGVYALALKKGESAVLCQGEREQVVQPCDLSGQKPNVWGLK